MNLYQGLFCLALRACTWLSMVSTCNKQIHVLHAGIAWRLSIHYNLRTMRVSLKSVKQKWVSYWCTFFFLISVRSETVFNKASGCFVVFIYCAVAFIAKLINKLWCTQCYWNTGIWKWCNEYLRYQFKMHRKHTVPPL